MCVPAVPLFAFTAWLLVIDRAIAGAVDAPVVTCAPPPPPLDASTALQVTVSLPSWNATNATNGNVLHGGMQLLYAPNATQAVPRAPRDAVALLGTPFAQTPMNNTNKTAGTAACQAACDADATCVVRCGVGIRTHAL